MRTFISQISKQTAIGQDQGRIAAVIGCERTACAAQHLGPGHAGRLHESRRQLSQLWHGLRSALAVGLDSAWHCALALCPSASDTATKAGVFKPTKSAWYSMPSLGLMPVAARRLPVVNPIGMPMPGSADC